MDKELKLDWYEPGDGRLLVIEEEIERMSVADPEGKRLVASVGVGNAQVHVGRVIKVGPDLDPERYVGSYVHYDRGSARQINLGSHIVFTVRVASVELIEDAEAVKVVSNREEWELKRRQTGPTGAPLVTKAVN